MNKEIFQEIELAQVKVDGLFERIYKKEEEKQYFKIKKKTKPKIISKSPILEPVSPQEIKKELLPP